MERILDRRYLLPGRGGVADPKELKSAGRPKYLS